MISHISKGYELLSYESQEEMLAKCSVFFADSFTVWKSWSGLSTLILCALLSISTALFGKFVILYPALGKPVVYPLISSTDAALSKFWKTEFVAAGWGRFEKKTFCQSKNIGNFVFDIWFLDNEK